MSIIKIAAGAAVAIGLTVSGAFAAGESEHHIEKQSWSFAGPFGTYDPQQLQRGFKVYREVCASCHSINRVKFRNLGEEGGPMFTEAEVKQIASEYQVTDGPDDFGDMFERPGKAYDAIPAPFPNDAAATAANGGKYPPDFSTLAKARAAHRGFPWFVFDAFTTYAEGGPDYIHALLVGYEEPPAELEDEAPPGAYYNTGYDALHGAPWIGMPNPLYEDAVEYSDGSPQTIDQYARDVSAFMMWAAEPHLNERKRMGFQVLTFLVIFSGLMWLTKRKLWSNIDH